MYYKSEGNIARYRLIPVRHLQRRSVIRTIILILITVLIPRSKLE